MAGSPGLPQATVTIESGAKACNTCKSTCEQTIAYCTQQGGKHIEKDHLQLLMDCIAICDACASSCDRKSPNHAAPCTACAEVCRQCADACATFKGDKQMQACTEACRTCADSCDARA